MSKFQPAKKAEAQTPFALYFYTHLSCRLGTILVVVMSRRLNRGFPRSPLKHLNLQLPPPKTVNIDGCALRNFLIVVPTREVFSSLFFLLKNCVLRCKFCYFKKKSDF